MIMASKRNFDDATDSDVEGQATLPSTKRQRSQQAASNMSKSQQPATDLTYGQRCVFPGVDQSLIHSDDDINYEDEQDAMAYLQSVR